MLQGITDFQLLLASYCKAGRAQTKNWRGFGFFSFLPLCAAKFLELCAFLVAKAVFLCLLRIFAASPTSVPSA